MNRLKSLARPSALTVAALMAAATLAACGGEGDSGSDSDSGSGSADAPGVAESQAMVDEYTSETGTYSEPPVEGGPKATADKSIWIISCGESSASCARATKGAVEAATAIGWDYNVFDTKGDYSLAGVGVRKAIAAKADGIYSYFIDCSYMQAPLREAKEAGVIAVQAEGVDCNMGDQTGDQLFAWSVSYNEGEILDWLRAWGQAQAAYLIADGGGEGNALFVTDNEAVGTLALNEAFEEQMKTCPGCDYTVAGYTFAEQYEGLGQKVGSELLKNPDINQIGVAYDGVLHAGVGEAIQQSGGNYTVISGEGQEPTIELLKSGVLEAGVGLDNEQESWSAIDSLNRIFNNEEPVSSGIGIHIYTEEANAPNSGPYVSPVDYQTAYKTSWGVE